MSYFVCIPMQCKRISKIIPEKASTREPKKSMGPLYSNNQILYHFEMQSTIVAAGLEVVDCCCMKYVFFFYFLPSEPSGYAYTLLPTYIHNYVPTFRSLVVQKKKYFRRRNRETKIVYEILFGLDVFMIETKNYVIFFYFFISYIVGLCYSSGCV